MLVGCVNFGRSQASPPPTLFPAFVLIFWLMPGHVCGIKSSHLTLSKTENLHIFHVIFFSLLFFSHFKRKVCSWFTFFFRSPAKCYLTSLTPTACWFFLKLQHKHGSRRKPVTLKNLKWAVTGFAFCFPNKCQFVYYASSFSGGKKKPLKACNEHSRDQARDILGMRCHRQHSLSSPLICEAGGRIAMMPHLVGGCQALRDSWKVGWES